MNCQEENRSKDQLLIQRERYIGATNDKSRRRGGKDSVDATPETCVSVSWEYQRKHREENASGGVE
jgi:hypothetical protein